MTRARRTLSDESGLALIQMTFALPVLLLFTGLAVDSGGSKMWPPSSRNSTPLLVAGLLQY